MPWVGLRCLIAVFHDHTYLLFYYVCAKNIINEKYLFAVSTHQNYLIVVFALRTNDNCLLKINKIIAFKNCVQLSTYQLVLMRQYKKLCISTF